MQNEPATDPSTIDFSHLQRLHPARKTAWCDVPEVGDDAALEGVFFGSGAKDPRVLRAALAAKPLQAPRSVADLEAIRIRQADYLAENVLRGWRGVTDKAGKAVEFTVENARQLLRMLPADIVGRIQTHFLTRQNFLAATDASATDLQETAGN